MSRAFMKEDAPHEEIVVPPRAPLPPGAVNRVTPRGLALLEAERAALTAERAHLHAEAEEGPERARRLAIVRGRLDELEARIAGAVVVEPGEATPGVVGFGATVTVRTLVGSFSGEESRFTIVGVDEAEPDEGRVAFTAPVATALLGRRVGDRVTLQVGASERLLEVVAVTYDAAKKITTKK